MARGSRLISLNPASATCVSSPEHPTRQHSAVSRALHCYPILRPSKRGAGFTTPGYPVVKPVLNLFLTCFSETKVKSLLSRTLLQVKANPESCFLKSCKFQQCGEGERQLRPPPENRLCPQSPPVSAARALEGEPTHTPQRGLLEPSVRDQDVPGTLPPRAGPPHVLRPRAGLAGGPDSSHVQALARASGAETAASPRFGPEKTKALEEKLAKPQG